MKFNDVQKVQDDQPKKVKIKQSSEMQTQLGVIDTMYRYGNVGVYIMKNNKKGLFREIASYINDGEKPASWALKVFHTDEWYIQFGINPNVDFENNDIYLSELLSSFEEKYEYLSVTGTKKVALLSSIEDKKQTEEITNYIINMFEGIELDFIDSTIKLDLAQDEAKKPMRINGYFPDNNKDKESQEKFIQIIDKLSTARMSADDTNKFNIIKKRIYNNTLRDKDKNTLNNLMKDYFSTHERVSLAMKYLKKDKT